MAITVKKGNFTLGFSIPTKDDLEKLRYKKADNKRRDAKNDVIMDMFSDTSTNKGSSDYMTAAGPISPKLGKLAPIMEKQQQQDIDEINKLQLIKPKLNKVPFSNITNELQRLQKELQDKELDPQAFAMRVSNLYKQLYDPKSGVLTDDDLLRNNALDTSLKGSISNYNTTIGNTKKSLEVDDQGVFVSELAPGQNLKNDYLARARNKIDFEVINVPSVNKPQKGIFASTSRTLAFFEKDAALEFNNVFEPITTELTHAQILANLQKTNPDLVMGNTDGLNSLGIQSDDIQNGINNRVRTLVRQTLKRQGIELANEQEDFVVEKILEKIQLNATSVLETTSASDAELVSFADAGLKSEGFFKDIATNIDTQFMINVKASPEVSELLSVLKEELNLEELIDTSEFDEAQKEQLFKKLDNILIGALVNKGAAGSNEQVLLGKGLIVFTKFLQDLGQKNIDPVSVATQLKISSENKVLFQNAMKRISAAKRDSVAILEKHPELKQRYTNYFDAFDVSERYSLINISLEKALSGVSSELPDSFTITEKEKSDLTSFLETLAESVTVASTPKSGIASDDGESDLGYSVSDNEINDFKDAAISTIMKNNMLDDLGLLNKFITAYTLEIDENMSVELQDKFKDMIINTINTQTESTV